MNERKRIIDISLALEPGMLKYPADPAFELERIKKIEKGDPANVSTFHMGSHTGTHVDPPSHFLEGQGGLDTIPLDHLVGRCQVIEIDEEWITAHALSAKWSPGAEIVLLRTRNSSQGLIRSRVFSEAYSALTVDAARFLVARDIKTIGIDYLSIEKPQTEHEKRHFPVHKELLQHRITILEGLDLTVVVAGEYFLSCLPLRVTGGDGGPSRAVLLAGP